MGKPRKDVYGGKSAADSFDLLKNNEGSHTFVLASFYESAKSDTLYCWNLFWRVVKYRHWIQRPIRLLCPDPGLYTYFGRKQSFPFQRMQNKRTTLSSLRNIKTFEAII